MRYTARSKKRTKRNKTQRRRKHKIHKRRGGNYERDVTTTELENVPIKGLNKTVIAFPGGVMSGTRYKDHMEYEDFHGRDS